jgi:hypothetical protein
MTTRNLTSEHLDVIHQRASWQDVVLVSKHDTQNAAEAERDRRNAATADRPWVVLEPIAQRIGGQCAPAAMQHGSERRSSP